MQEPIPDIRELFSHFAHEGEYGRAELWGNGHINDTFRIVCTVPGGERLYILQRLNHHVFQEPELVMANIARVCDHLAARPRLDGECVLRLIPTRNGASHVRDPHGCYWRLFPFIEGTRAPEIVESAEHARQAARAFARFQLELVDLPAPRLHDTIPDFHHTPRRYEAFAEALAADPLGRAAACRSEIAFVQARESYCGRIIQAMAAGHVPERITHNDTKVNNVLLDAASGAGICVIDLDTVMPGSALFDFGDLVRSAGGSFAENERDLHLVRLDLERFEALICGYLEEAREFLCPAEIELLAEAGRVITLECGMRFLTDHLLGDKYFRIHHPGENLDRARTQFAFVADMERLEPEMRAIVRRNL